VAEAGGRRWLRAVGCGWWPWLVVDGSGGHEGVAAVGGGCGWHRGAAAALRDMLGGRAACMEWVRVVSCPFAVAFAGGSFCMRDSECVVRCYRYQLDSLIRWWQHVTSGCHMQQVVYLCTGDSFAVTVHASGSNGMLGGTCSTLTASHLDKTVARMAWSFWARSDAYIVC